EQLALVYRKGVHSYDYIDSQYRFQETELPLIHEFYNTLKEFQKMSIEYYELDPNHYVSAPSLFWDGMLKISGVMIELFTI
ncbi:968_t:CDS:2, partial [Funneliformis geosporum]